MTWQRILGVVWLFIAAGLSAFGVMFSFAYPFNTFFAVGFFGTLATTLLLATASGLEGKNQTLEGIFIWLSVIVMLALLVLTIISMSTSNYLPLAGIVVYLGILVSGTAGYTLYLFPEKIIK